MQSKAHGEAHQQITIGSLNIQNILANEVYLRAVLSQCDLLCVQEHWIFSNRKSIFQEIITSHEVEAKSVDNENPLFDHKSIRGFAGIATCWKKNLSHAVKVQEEGNHRIMVTTIACKPTPICIINVCMPTTGNNQNDNYSESLEQISELLEKYSSHSIILIGDMNASLHRDDRQRDKNYPIKPTFFHHNRRYSSQINYVLCDPEMLELSPDVEIHDMSPLNTSDHTLIIVSFHINVEKKKTPCCIMLEKKPSLVTTNK